MSDREEDGGRGRTVEADRVEGVSGTELAGGTDGAGDPERGAALERPVNPLSALTLVLVFPRRTFERLQARPHWVLPLLFVAAAVLTKSLLSLESGVLDRILENEAFLTGVDIADVRAGAPATFVVLAVFVVPVVILFQALLYKVAGAIFGGKARFVAALSAVAYASVPIGVGALAAAALIPVTRSADLGADLTRLVDPTVHPFLWGLLRELGIVPLWSYCLLVLAARPVFGLPKRRAFAAAGLFVAAQILIMSYLGIEEARRQVAPHSGWTRVDARGVVLYFPEGTDGSIEREATEAATAAAGRLTTLLGAEGERIECYVYPSVREKQRVTGNAALAHGVTWANAVHVAWEGPSGAAMAREMTHVAGARALGKVYNPFIRNGLAVYGGQDPSGRVSVEAARQLQDTGALPRLELLLEPPDHARIDTRLSDAAAGAFTAFLVRELGLSAYREFYAGVARARTGIVAAPASVPDALESALGRPLRDIEADWIRFIMEGSSVPAGAGSR